MNNRKLATFLDVARKQRARQRGVFVDQFGTDSAAVKELDVELDELDALIIDAKKFGEAEARIVAATEPDLPGTDKPGKK